MRPVISLIISLLCGIVLCVLIPQCAYLRNVNEFSFDSLELLRASVFPFVMVSFLSFAVLSLLSLFSNNKNEKYVFMGKQFKISIFHIAVLIILCLLWLEGAVISNGLKKLDGTNTNQLYSIARLIPSIAAWISGLLLLLFSWRGMARKFIPFVCIILALYLSTLGDILRKTKEKTRVEADYDVVLQNTAFHPKNNVIVLIPDSVPTFAAKYVIDNNEDIRKKLKGFVLYENNLGPGHATAWALPAILKNETIKAADDVSFFNDVLITAKGFPRRFFNKGYDVFLTSLLPRFTNILTTSYPVLETKKIKTRFTTKLSAQLIFGFCPFFLKLHLEPFLYEPMVMMDFPMDRLYKDLIPAINRYSSRPTAHFHHYMGSHVPFLHTRTGLPLPKSEKTSEKGLFEETEWIFRNFVYFLDKLEQKGIYDSSTIVFMADHGNVKLADNIIESEQNYTTGLSAFNAPLFMIKPPNTYGAFQYSLAPTSSVNMPYFTEELGEGKTLSELEEALSDERFFFGTDEHIHAVKGVSLRDAKVNKINDSAIARSKANTLHANTPYILTITRSDHEFAIPSFGSGAVKLFSNVGIQYFMDQGAGELGFIVEGVSDKATVHLTGEYHSETINDVVWDTPRQVNITDLTTGILILENYELPQKKRFTILIPGLTVDENKQIKFSITITGKHVATIGFSDILITNFSD